MTLSFQRAQNPNTNGLFTQIITNADYQKSKREKINDSDFV